MKEHVYRISPKKVIGKSFYIWLFVSIQLIGDAFIIPSSLANGQYGVILFVNVLLGSISIPGIYIFFNYLKHSTQKEFIVMYDSIKMFDRKNNTVVEIISPEIDRIEFHQNLYPYSVIKNLLPWTSHEYFRFVDKSGKKIVVTSYIMDLSRLWLDTLARRIDSNKIVRSENIFPAIRD